MRTALTERFELTVPVVGSPMAEAAGGELAAGAAGAWVGTAFLACPEATVTAAARERIVAAAETDTNYGRVFDLGMRQAWPAQYGGRALRNPFFEHWQGRGPELPGDDRAHAELLAAVERRDFDTAYIYAGQGVGLVRQPRPAAAVVAELATDDDLLRRAGSPV